jgi:hypothetical protein
MRWDGDARATSQQWAEQRRALHAPVLAVVAVVAGAVVVVAVVMAGVAVVMAGAATNGDVDHGVEIRGSGGGSRRSWITSSV